MWLALFAIYRLANHRQGPREELIKGCCFPWASRFCAANVEKSARHSVTAAPSTEVRRSLGKAFVIWNTALISYQSLWSNQCGIMSGLLCSHFLKCHAAARRSSSVSLPSRRDMVKHFLGKYRAMCSCKGKKRWREKKTRVCTNHGAA